jgi:hypothetical protein
MMDLLPFASFCRACGSDQASYRYCVTECLSNGSGGYEPIQRLGDSRTLPHLHRVCARCGYAWLERCLGLQPTAISRTAAES